MGNDELQQRPWEERRDWAVRLREQGLSRSQIADAMGLASAGRSLDRWLKDTPPPAWTKRPNAKDNKRSQARELRREGRSVRAITEELAVSKSSVSLWVRDIELTEDQKAKLAANGRTGLSKQAEGNRATAARRRAAVESKAMAQVTELAESELFVAGLALYWAEGSKAKPWRLAARVVLINSDPDVVRLFLAWLELIGVDRGRLKYRLSIHESADVAAATAYWASVAGVDPSCFFTPTLKRHNAKTVRRNTEERYHGCLVVTVARSTELYWQISGWWRGLVAAAFGTSSGSLFDGKAIPDGA